MSDSVLKMVGISKSFGGVAALRNVDLELRAGEVHALLGENGAGKSSLMKILMGVHQPDEGELIVGGGRVRFSNPAEAQRNRVSMVYQETRLRCASAGLEKRTRPPPTMSSPSSGW